jgi:hypothetical protein
MNSICVIRMAMATVLWVPIAQVLLHINISETFLDTPIKVLERTSATSMTISLAILRVNGVTRLPLQLKMPNRQRPKLRILVKDRVRAHTETGTCGTEEK